MGIAVITIINHPFGNGLYHLFQLSMVIWGMVHFCYTHIKCVFKPLNIIARVWGWLISDGNLVKFAIEHHVFLVCKIVVDWA